MLISFLHPTGPFREHHHGEGGLAAMQAIRACFEVRRRPHAQTSLSGSGRLPHTRRASCKRVRHEGRTPALAISRTSPLARGVSRFSSLRMSSRLGPATSMRKAQIGSWIDQKEQQDKVPSSCPLLRASVARPRRGHGMLSLSTEQHAIERAIAFEWRLSMDFARLRGPVQLESSQRVGRGR
jgi:hypothetical protein